MNLLEMSAIEKKFGNVTAISHGHIQLKKGEVHALLGANGAGKSTLIKILSGLYPADAGEMKLSGNIVKFKSPRDAKAAGIFTVYQEVDTAIVPDLTVAENIMLDTFSTMKGVFVSTKELNIKATQMLEQLNAESIDVTKSAVSLTLAEKQLVLIARALVQDAKIIIFDEPTAPLSVTEAEQLFIVIRTLKDKGVSSLFISHRLHEVFEICDVITVMREGQHVYTKETAVTNQYDVIEAMLGKTFEESVRDTAVYIDGEPLLTVDNLHDGRKVHGTNFTLHKGEILGIVGLVGAGKTELAKLLFGNSKKARGEVVLNNKTLKLKHPQHAINEGIVLIPEERRKEGLFIEESISTNTSFPNLKKFSTLSFMLPAKEVNFAQQVIKKLGVKAYNSQTMLTSLSGGNQQKVAIGKWLSHESKVYIFDEPTKGVDIGAKVDIFNTIRQVASEGKGVLYLSSEIHEILLIADRILVMYDGKIVKSLSKAEATQEKILLYASGGKEE